MGVIWIWDIFWFLSVGKNYFKSVYKSYLGLEEVCVDYCIVFVLLDLFEERFLGECCYDYN